jgi:hypothetical protein
LFLSHKQDQDKITAQQKSMKEAEQERQWKALQAMRQREQQMGVAPDGRMHHMNGEIISELGLASILNVFLSHSH